MGVQPGSRLGRSIGRRFLFEWAGTACAGIVVVLLGVLWHLTSGIDHLVYDRYLNLRSRPASQDIVLVEIDNASIDAFGRWPWPRSVHAQLVDRLADAGAAAVVYDVLFTERSPDDERFARALSRVPSFLPILLNPADDSGRRVAVRPVGPLAQAAAGLGHINLEVDSDGIVRSVALFEGDADSRWPQLMVPLWRKIRDGDVKLADRAAATRDAADPSHAAGADSEARFLIPFGAGANAYRKVSFAQVLAGQVPPDLLRGRVVLVGVTASGLYDRFATPLSGELGPLPGVYIHANVLDTLLTGTAIQPVSSAWVVAVSLVPLALLVAGFLVLSPWRTLLLLVGLVAASLGGSAALLYGARLWLSPVPAIVALLVVYPAWSWRRLEMTMAYLRKELRRLADEPYLLPEAQTPAVRGEFGGDALAQQMALMAQAAQRLQDMRRFVWDSLDAVPEPILVADLRGVVLIANHAARAYFERLGARATEGRLMSDAFGDVEFVKTIDSGADATSLARANWPAPLDPARAEFAALMASGVEVRARDGRDYLLRYARCTDAQGQAVGWIAGLVDVTPLHDAERQREDALRLLSHDMRSPQASIVALVETERKRGSIESEPARAVMERIERYARRALKLADDFVQLARAESQTYTLEPASLADLLIDASDEVWPQARAKRIQIDTQCDGDEMGWISADRSLMTRALVNLLNNAVKYSPEDTRIVCTIRMATGGATGGASRVICAISDQGYGIAAEDQTRLFEPFRRFHAGQRPEISGAGLGMAFVWTVVTRHGGDVGVESEPGRGTTITLSLPALDAPP
ncbi:CHASE2 domain-containing protein [Paraburkholderia caballeronis]|uniref:histidine kinase n=1 Tax=Paraburkholderia caballeronis TaxID=416943 RepID=A0A1H7VXC3_9BURK|nr:CHASE2 domain-containing protein [Paraburkholderia caballeronis]PXW14619.1 CHASE2 domain-containing sensor protein [Paraburkholderia caballeronis]PXW93447.1 CHASE2 domain-containing sensor protein [Paraburkholderia caballeronis]RAJ88306.1 CHASE2 domain-containing sensor protein [Paraburkholderia caballeronis]SEE21349.1 sensor domain CHASE2-containing protein [Paraburkholderia caballeronis]SEM13906.1 sensor domain CHASE2-containing protein [Paraburkholderia caballeronis]